MSEEKHRAYLGLGTNLGDKEANILEAYRLIETHIGSITKRSAMYHSEPWGFESDNAFINTVIEVETSLSPLQLLAATQEQERIMGRTHKSTGGVYHDRIIDIDILLYDDITMQTPELTIPHPLMQQRDFVMQPLKELGIRN